jgi:hypothetical protein
LTPINEFSRSSLNLEKKSLEDVRATKFDNDTTEAGNIFSVVFKNAVVEVNAVVVEFAVSLLACIVVGSELVELSYGLVFMLLFSTEIKHTVLIIKKTKPKN